MFRYHASAKSQAQLPSIVSVPGVIVVWICVDDESIQRNVHLLFDEPLVLGFAFLDKIILLEQLLERD